jgi:hypothetical protein
MRFGLNTDTVSQATGKVISPAMRFFRVVSATS